MMSEKLIAYADQGVVVSMDMDKSRSKEEVDRLEKGRLLYLWLRGILRLSYRNLRLGQGWRKRRLHDLRDVLLLRKPGHKSSG